MTMETNRTSKINLRVAQGLSVIVDVDGVLADIHTPWLSMYNNEYQDNLTVDNITSWDIDKFVKPECGNRIYDYLGTDSLYEKSPEIAGAWDGVLFLWEQGFDVSFVTAGVFTTKAKWMLERGYISSLRFDNNFIICKNKQRIKADIIIDDNIDNLKGFKYPICFDQPWNREYTGIRAFGWKDVTRIITDIIAKENQRWNYSPY